MIDEKLLKSEERAVFNLRSLYRAYGYVPYSFSKFEDYELYITHKDFLVSDRFITFNDTNGQLLALKPDVTLSIIKQGEDEPGVKQKVYYNENVYRVSEATGHFKEIMQTGLECIGDIDLYDIFEVVSLAAQSLGLITDAFVLDVSHLGLLSAVLDRACTDESFAPKALRYIAEKNAHDLARLCEKFGIGTEDTRTICAFTSTYGPRDEVIAALEGLCGDMPELAELKALSALIDTLPCSDAIRFDFSVVNDMSYYNGFVFKGFVDGVCEGVLSGGQYDKMMSKMNRTAGAIGFALYLDLLEQLERGSEAFRVDTLLVYDESVDAQQVADKVAELVAAGQTVSAQKAVPEGLRYKSVVTLGKEA